MGNKPEGLIPKVEEEEEEVGLMFPTSSCKI
jgi:hypothetical protein